MNDEGYDEFEVEDSMLKGLIEGQVILIQLRSCVVWMPSRKGRLVPMYSKQRPAWATYFDPMDCCGEPEEIRVARVEEGELRICSNCISTWANDYIISQAETPADLGFVS